MQAHWVDRRLRYIEAKDTIKRKLTEMNQLAERGQWTDDRFLRLKRELHALVDEL